MNGVRVQDQTEIEGATASHALPRINRATGPLHLQDHGNRVRYRNVWLVELKEDQP